MTKTYWVQQADVMNRDLSIADIRFPQLVPELAVLTFSFISTEILRTLAIPDVPMEDGVVFKRFTYAGNEWFKLGIVLLQYEEVITRSYDMASPRQHRLSGVSCRMLNRETGATKQVWSYGTAFVFNRR